MTAFLYATQLLSLICVFEGVVGKSCRYDNLHAVYDWLAIKSPGYPGKFPAQTQCHWRVTAPPQYRVQLEFTDFSLVKPNSENRCVWQWLNVIEGGLIEDEVTPPMLTLCGTNKPRIVISRGNSINLNLHSNSALGKQTYKGFAVRYKYTRATSFMPESMSNLPPPKSSSNGQGSSSSSSVSGPTIGDMIGSFKPKKLPPNPNAVLTLQNKRTEAKNKMRNNGVNAENNMQNNEELYYRDRSRTKSPRPTINSMSDNIISQDELPPKRGKPLPHEIKILLIVLGTIGAIALILYLLKKYVYDRMFKNGSESHAYSHFRKSKKKRQNKENKKESKINTVAESTNSTVHSQDSGLATSTDHSSHNNGVVLHATRTQRHEDLAQKNTVKKKSEVNKEPNETHNIAKKIRNVREDVDIKQKYHTTVRQEHENSASSGRNIDDDDSQRRKRRRRHHRRSSSLEKTPSPAPNNRHSRSANKSNEDRRRQTRRRNNHSRDHRDSTETKNEGDHKTRSRTRKNERQRSYSMSSSSSYERVKTRTWRDNAYS